MLCDRCLAKRQAWVYSQLSRNRKSGTTKRQKKVNRNLSRSMGPRVGKFDFLCGAIGPSHIVMCACAAGHLGIFQTSVAWVVSTFFQPIKLQIDGTPYFVEIM